MKEIIEINTDAAKRPMTSDDMITVRNKIADIHEASKETAFEATLVVIAYNRLEKTKSCVESIFKYTSHINFNLVLIDNGSTDGETLEYFKSIDYDETCVVHITKNILWTPDGFQKIWFI